LVILLNAEHVNKTASAFEEIAISIKLEKRLIIEGVTLFSVCKNDRREESNKWNMSTLWFVFLKAFSIGSKETFVADNKAIFIDIPSFRNLIKRLLFYKCSSLFEL